MDGSSQENKPLTRKPRKRTRKLLAPDEEDVELGRGSEGLPGRGGVPIEEETIGKDPEEEEGFMLRERLGEEKKKKKGKKKALDDEGDEEEEEEDEEKEKDDEEDLRINEDEEKKLVINEEEKPKQKIISEESPGILWLLRFIILLLILINFLYVSICFCFLSLFWQVLDDDGILINSFISLVNKIFTPIAFFANLFTYILIKNYQRGFLFYWMILFLTFGILMVLPSIVCVMLSGTRSESETNSSWERLSTIEKAYFDDTVGNYSTFYNRNGVFVSFFLMIEAIILILIGIGICFIYNMMPENFLPKSQSRKPWYKNGIVTDDDILNFEEIKRIATSNKTQLTDPTNQLNGY